MFESGYILLSCSVLQCSIRVGLSCAADYGGDDDPVLVHRAARPPPAAHPRAVSRRWLCLCRHLEPRLRRRHEQQQRSAAAASGRLRRLALRGHAHFRRRHSYQSRHRLAVPCRCATRTASTCVCTSLVVGLALSLSLFVEPLGVMSAPLIPLILDVLSEATQTLLVRVSLDAVQQLSTGDHSEERIRIRIRTSA